MFVIVTIMYFGFVTVLIFVIVALKKNGADRFFVTQFFFAQIKENTMGVR